MLKVDVWWRQADRLSTSIVSKPGKCGRDTFTHLFSSLTFRLWLQLHTSIAIAFCFGDLAVCRLKYSKGAQTPIPPREPCGG